MSIRAVALNSFVLLAREVVSVLLQYRVVALMVKFNDRLPALFAFVNIVNREAAMPLRDALERRFLQRDERLRRFPRLVSMNIRKHFHWVVGAAFCGYRVEYPDQLTAHSDNGLLFLQGIFCPGGVIVVQAAEFRVAFDKRDCRTEQDGAKFCPASFADSRLPPVLA